MRRWAALTVALAAGLVAGAALLPGERHPTPPLLLQGVATGPDGVLAQVPVGVAAAFVPGSSVLVPSGGRGTGDVVVAPGGIVAEQRAWLAAGRVPGTTAEDRAVAERALLDLRALTVADGGVAAAWRSYWRYVWPRDSSFVAAAYAVTGHHEEALSVLRRLGRLQERDGTWQARYTLDGDVPDDRGRQLDGNGWVLWATWTWYRSAPDPAKARAQLVTLWPTVEAAADAAAASLGRTGLPPAGQDYWEVPQDVLTLGVAAPLLSGLRAAADLAASTGRTASARRWQGAADDLATAVDREFAPEGYRRVAASDRRWTLGPHGYPSAPATAGLDTAVTFLAPPFGPERPTVRAAVNTAGRVLELAHGGVRPGEDWNDVDEAWTPSTGLLALSAAAAGDTARARDRLGWLVAHRTGVGSFPERVAATGPVSVAPLAWTSALYLLALTALEEGLPTVPSGALSSSSPPP